MYDINQLFDSPVIVVFEKVEGLVDAHDPTLHCLAKLFSVHVTLRVFLVRACVPELKQCVDTLLHA